MRPRGREGIGYALVIGADLCWGIFATVVKLLFNLGAVDPLRLTAIRLLFSFGFLFLVLVPARGRSLAVRGRDLPTLLVIGIIGLGANSFFYYTTISLTSVATAILLAYFAPVLIALYEAAFRRIRVPWNVTAALILALVGCALVVRAYDPAIFRLNLPGFLSGLATACIFAFYSVAGQQVMARYGPWTLLLYGYGFAALGWAVLARPWVLVGQVPSPAMWGVFVAVSLFGTLLPFALFTWSLRYAPAGRITIVSTLEPVVAAVSAWVVLGERMGALQIVGGLLVLAGSGIVQLRQPKTR